MTIARTGSVGVYNGGKNNSGSTTITVPADAAFAVVCLSTYANVASYFSGGSITIGGQTMQVGLIKEDQTYLMGGVWVLANPPTGDQTLAWDLGGTTAPAEENMFHYAFYKGVDLANPIRSSGGQQVSAGNATTGVLTAQSGDFAVAFGWLYYSSAAGGNYIDWTGATEVREDGSGADNDNIISYAEASPTGNIELIRVRNAGLDGGVIGLVLKPSAGGGTDYVRQIAETVMVY